MRTHIRLDADNAKAVRALARMSDIEPSVSELANLILREALATFRRRRFRKNGRNYFVTIVNKVKP